MNLKAIFTAKNLLILVAVLVVALILAVLAIHFEADLKIILIAASGALLVIVLRFAWLVAQKGWGWGLTVIHAWVNRGKADLTAFDQRVTTLEGRMTTLENTVLPPLKQPAAAVAAAVKAAGNVVEGVVQSPNQGG